MVKPENQIIISLSDLWSALKKQGFTMAVFVAVFMFLLCYYLTAQTPVYKAEALFKTPKKESGGLGATLLSMSGAGGGGYMGNDSPKDFLASYPVSERVVKRLCLNGHIVELKKQNQRSARFQSLLAFKAKRYFGARAPSVLVGAVEPCPSKSELPFSLVESPISFKQLIYPLDVATTMTLRFIDDRNFVADDKKPGRLDEPFTNGAYTFTIKSNGESLKGRSFHLALAPVYNVAKALGEQLTVEADKENKQLLKITYSHAHPEVAAKVINTFLDEYMLYQKAQGAEKIDHQLKYLASREQDVLTKLRRLTKAQAAFAKEEIQKGSFSLLGDPKSATVLYREACKLFSTLSLDVQTIYESLYGEQKPIEEILTSVDISGSAHNIASSKSSQALLLQLNRLINDYDLKFTQYENLCSLLDQEDFQFYALSKESQDLLTDSEITRLSRHVAGPNHTARERSFAAEQINEEKGLIRQRLAQLLKLEKAEQSALKQKLKSIQTDLLVSLIKEIKVVERDVANYLIRCGEHVDQALFEHSAFLNKEVLSKFQGEILGMAEAKNLAFNLESIQSKPFQRAIPPRLPEPPKLQKWGIIGAFFGLFVAFVYILLKEVFHGPTASQVNLRALGRRVLKEEELLMELLKGGPLFGLISKEFGLEVHLVKRLNLAGKKPLLFYLRGSGTSCLEKLAIKDKGTHAELELGKIADLAILQSPAFKKLLDELGQSYDTIALVGGLTYIRAISCLTDSVIFSVTDERVSELEGLPEGTLYFHPEAQPVQKKSLKERLAALQLSTQANFSSSSSV